MTYPIFKGIISAFLILSVLTAITYEVYIGRLAWATPVQPVILKAQCAEPQVTSIQFNAEIIKFIVLNNRLHLLMPLPITGSSATIVDIRAAMKKVRK